MIFIWQTTEEPASEAEADKRTQITVVWSSFMTHNSSTELNKPDHCLSFNTEGVPKLCASSLPVFSNISTIKVDRLSQYNCKGFNKYAEYALLNNNQVMYNWVLKDFHPKWSQWNVLMLKRADLQLHGEFCYTEGLIFAGSEETNIVL